MSTIALFGGSFNPPHVAHQMVALWVLEVCDVAEVWVVPTWRHAFSKELAAFEHRHAMCERAMRPLGDRVRVSDIERQMARPSSRTLETLEELGARHRQHSFRVVIGADILRETHKWYRWDEIERVAPPIVVGRSGYPSGASDAGFELPPVSSTEIRARLGRGESCAPLVPRSVLEYIADRGLYGQAGPVASSDA